MSEWISVNDTLPTIAEGDKSYEEYNVYCVHLNDKIVTTLDFTEHGWFDCTDRDWNDFVTHWMPLPKPPEDIQ